MKKRKAIFNVHTKCTNLFPAQNCPALTNLSHVQLSTLQTEFSTMVTVTCSYGYQFIDSNRTTIEVKCVDGGMWNASLSPCQGQSYRFLKLKCQFCEDEVIHDNILYTEVTCTTVPSAVNASRINTDPVATGGRYQYLTNITYQCLPEMRLEDGHVVGNSTCVGVNSWSTKDVTCSRKDLYYILYIY